MFTKGQILVRIKPCSIDSQVEQGATVKFIKIDECFHTHMDVQVLKSNTAKGVRTCRISDFKPVKLTKRKQL